MAGYGDTEEYIGDIEAKDTSFKGKLESFLKSRYFLAAAVLLVSIIAFSLGRLSALEEKREPIRIVDSGAGEVKGDATGLSNSAAGQSESGISAPVTPQGGQVVASKSGTKYHYPWCAGAKQISEKNKIYVDSIEAARAAGYTPASNCKGLK
jgi:hypothetical protein